MFVFIRALRLGFAANLRALFGIACILSAPVLFAQTAPETTKPEETEKKEPEKKTLELSKFSVTTTQDRGFIMNNSAGAFRTNEVLLNIPQTVVVVTRDMINAIQNTDTSGVLAYFGMVPHYEGEEMTSRGGGMLAFQDDVPQGGVPFADNSVIDSYEIIKGAAQVLYLSNNLSGVVLKNTKKPLPYKRDVVEASFDSHGSMRAMVDSTGPLGEIGGAKISYRFVGAYRDDAEVFVNLDHKALVIMPQIQVDFKNTRIRAYYQRSNLVRSPNQSALLQPDGNVSIPPTGYKHANRLTKNSMEDHDSNVGHLEVNTQLSDTWENRFKVSYRHSKREGSNPLALYANWDTRQVGYITRKLDLPSAAVVIMNDLQGKYNIGWTEHTDAFGFIEAEQIFWNSIWGAPTLPDNSIWKNTIYLPIDDANNLIETDKYAAPKLTDYDGSKVNFAKSRQSTKNRLVYYAHSANITKYLTLTGGISWSQVEVSGITNLSVRPYTTTTPTLQDEMLHRYGVVVKPITGLSLYALESTTFNAASGGGQVLSDGSFPSNPIGKNREVGLKTELFGGRLTSNFSIFDMTITGNLRLGGIRPDGSIFYEPVPGNSTRTKGYDMNVGIGLIEGLQLLGSYSYYHNKTAAYAHPASSWSVFVDYKFPRNSKLGGLTVGGGSYHADGRYVSLSGTYTYSGITAEEQASGLKKINDTGTPVKVYAAYTYNKHLDLRLSVDNLFNEIYAYGGIGGLHTVLDMGLPRTITLNATYKF